MEMYYDGALVMPKNYAVVDEEEMTYVEGGRGCLIYSWASAYDTAADQARQLGHRRCVFEAHTSGLTMIASIRAC